MVEELNDMNEQAMGMEFAQEQHQGRPAVKSHMASNYRSASEREQRVIQNIQNAQALHNEKLNKSNVNFKNTRVTSCSGVLMKNGKAVAMTFKQPAKCYQKEGDPLRSSETASVAA